jgi:N-acyl-L-homoserine lactone synthetase
MLRIKRVHTAALREKVYRLRYRAYRKENAIPENSTGMFHDAFDEQPNHVLWALADGDQVIGAVRTTWFDPTQPHLIPEMHAYAEDLRRAIPSGARICSGNRLVTEPDLALTTARFAMLLMRLSVFTAAAKGADWQITTSRGNHLKFYRRVFGAPVVSEGKLYPGLQCKMSLMAMKLDQVSQRIRDHLPCMQPRGYEAMFLDPSRQHMWEEGHPEEVAA